MPANPKPPRPTPHRAQPPPLPTPLPGGTDKYRSAHLQLCCAWWCCTLLACCHWPPLTLASIDALPCVLAAIACHLIVTICMRAGRHFRSTTTDWGLSAWPWEPPICLIVFIIASPVHAGWGHWARAGWGHWARGIRLIRRKNNNCVETTALRTRLLCGLLQSVACELNTSSAFPNRCKGFL